MALELEKPFLSVKEVEDNPLPREVKGGNQQGLERTRPQRDIGDKPKAYIPPKEVN